MKILVIGCKGFIGSNLIEYFIAKGYNVVGTDIMDEPISKEYIYLKYSPNTINWETIFKMQQFDVCINAAGSGNVAYSLINPLADFETNTLDVIRILDSIRRYQYNCKYQHISSAAVYGNPKQLPIHEMDELNPVSPYGFHKLISEQICKEYYQLYGLPIIVIRPFSVYGPGLRKQLFWDICTNIYQSTSKSIRLFGTGRESRDFIYIDDLASLIEILIIKGSYQNVVYNAASGVETSIEKVATQIKDCLPNTQIHFSGEIRDGDPKNWCANIDKINALGYKTRVNLRAGIEKYINWFKMLEFNEK